MNLPPFVYVSGPKAWRRCLDQIQREPRLAIDLESNSMYAYRESVCLIQISTPEQDFILDPTCDFDITPLGVLIADPHVEKIFHAAEYDLILVKRQYGWGLQNLFDTMWAARILGYKRFGLASLLHDIFQIKLNKKYQKSNWCKRPLAPEQLAYAQHDTHFLFRLRDHLNQELNKKGCLEEAVETFEQQTHVQLSDNGFDPDSFWSINGVRDLNKRQQAALKALNIFRDQEARRRDKPLFKIINDRTLVALAKKMPTDHRQLAGVHGMTNGQMKRFGRQILQVIKDAKHAPYPKYPYHIHQRPPEAVISRYDALRQWRKQRARRRGVESDVIMSRNALWEIARDNPKTHEALCRLQSIGDWRCNTYGDEILHILGNSSE